jgi:hypothetical protein
MSLCITLEGRDTTTKSFRSIGILAFPIPPNLYLLQRIILSQTWETISANLNLIWHGYPEGSVGSSKKTILAPHQ